MNSERLAIAASFLGVREIPRIESDPRIARWLSRLGFRGHDETPWCAAFVNAVLELSGEVGTGSARARSFETWGRPVAAHCEAPGYIVVLWRKKPNGPSGHVGFFLRYEPGQVWLLGGNQANSVSARAYPRSRIVAIRT